MNNPPPAIYYVENEDGSFSQVLHLGCGSVSFVPIAKGSDGEDFMRRVGIRLERAPGEAE